MPVLPVTYTGAAGYLHYLEWEVTAVIDNVSTDVGDLLGTLSLSSFA